MSRPVKSILDLLIGSGSRRGEGGGLGPLVLCLAMVGLLLLPLSIFPGGTAEGPRTPPDVHFNTLENEDYSVKVDLDKKADFHWVLENLNDTRTYDVGVTGWADTEDWKVTVKEAEFTLGPLTTRLVEVSVRSTVAEDGDIGIVFVSVLLVEAGTGDSFYFNATATVTLDLKIKGGIDVFTWHFDLPSELDNPFARFLILLVIWCLAIYILVVAFLDGLFRFAVRKTKTKIDDIVLDIIKKPVIILAVVYGAIDTLEVLDVPGDWLGHIHKVYNIVAIAAVGYIVYKVFKDVLIYYGEQHAKDTGSEALKMIIPLINNIVSVVILAIVGSLIASYLGYDITVAIAGLGIMGLVIAFAAQDTLSNFFSGIHLLLDRPFAPGDLVILEDGEMCEIKNVGFRSARLYDVVEHVLITLPNNKLANAKIVNITAPDFKYRLKLEVSVAYGSDVELVREVLLDMANSHSNLLKEGRFGPTVRFRRFGESSLNFELYVWIEDIRKDNYLVMNRVRSELNEGIDKEFRRHKIKIPFPQREVWVSTMASPSGASGKD